MRNVLRAAMVLAIGAGLTPVAWGQCKEMSPDIVNAEQSLNSAQEAARDAYVACWIKQIISGPRLQVAAARQRVVDPLVRARPNQVFSRTYPTAVVTNAELRNALNAGDAVVRANALLLLAEMIDQGVLAESLPLVSPALTDAGKGGQTVRYLAAECVVRMGRTQKLSAAQEQGLLTALQTALNKETSQPVAGKLLMAMGSLALPEAKEAVLKAAGARVAQHLANPQLSLNAEREAIFDLWIRSVALRVATGGDKLVPDSLIKQMALAAYHYVRLASKLARDTQAYDRKDLIEMVTQGEKVLAWCRERLGVKTPLPTQLYIEASKATDKGWESTWLIVVDDWSRVLKDPAIGFSSTDLELK